MTANIEAVLGSMAEWDGVGNVPIDQVREWRALLTGASITPTPQQIVEQYVALTRKLRTAEHIAERTQREVQGARAHLLAFWETHGRQVPLGAYLVEDGTHALVVNNVGEFPPLVAVALNEDAR